MKYHVRIVKPQPQKTPQTKRTVSPLRRARQLASMRYRSLLAKKQGIEVKSLTPEEAAAIPRDRYFVIPLFSRHARADKKKIIYLIIKKTEEIYKLLKQYYAESLEHDGGDGGGGAPNTFDVFQAPIDENKMAKSIYTVFNGFFHDQVTCEICKIKFNRMAFCALIRIFFLHCKLLKNESIYPFGNYLAEKVFGGQSDFCVRSLNTYVTDYRDVEGAFTKDTFKADFKFNTYQLSPPSDAELKKTKPENNPDLLKPAFQIIGNAFQKTDYFNELRELQNTVKSFIL